MAISFKSDKDYGFSLLPLFGVASSIIHSAKDAGVSVDQSSPGTFVIKMGDSVYGSVPVKGSAISLAKSKTLGPASKEALKFQFEAALNKAIAASGYSLGNTATLSEMPESPKPKVAVKNPLAGLSPSVAKAPVGMFPKYDPCSLSMATKVYEPVTGTTGGSVYFVLAIFDGMNIAARVAGKKLSLRAEGPKLKSYQSALDELGMDAKSSYSSGHYDVSSTGLMIKALGALVGRVGFSKVKALADIETFIGGQ